MPSVEELTKAILQYLEPRYYEELTHQQMKLIADEIGRKIFLMRP